MSKKSSHDKLSVYFSLTVCRHATTQPLRSCQLVAESFLIIFFTKTQPSLKFHLSYCCCSRIQCCSSNFLLFDLIVWLYPSTDRLPSLCCFFKWVVHSVKMWPLKYYTKEPYFCYYPLFVWSDSDAYSTIQRPLVCLFFVLFVFLIFCPFWRLSKLF